MNHCQNKSLSHKYGSHLSRFYDGKFFYPSGWWNIQSIYWFQITMLLCEAFKMKIYYFMRTYNLMYNSNFIICMKCNHNAQKFVSHWHDKTESFVHFKMLITKNASKLMNKLYVYNTVRAFKHETETVQCQAYAWTKLNSVKFRQTRQGKIQKRKVVLSV